MADHPSDSELADMDDAETGSGEYPLAKTDPTPPPVMPFVVEEAIKKAEEKTAKPPPLRPFQFTIRDMLVATTVIAFLLGLIVSIHRGMSVSLIYLIVTLVMAAAWFGVGLWEAGYWQKARKPGPDDPPLDDFNIAPIVKPARQPLQYSLVDLFLLVSAFAFLMSLCTLLPGQNKLVNAAGFSGFCTLAGLLWLALNESRHPLFLLLWWLMFLMYLLTSLAVLLMG